MLGEHLGRRRVIVAAVTLALVAGLGGAAYSLGSSRDAPATPVARRAVPNTPTPARTAGPTTTPEPLPKADTVSRAGVPKPPVELAVPFVGGAWPVGLFVLSTGETPAKKTGYKTVAVELGILNEASQPLLIAVAGQYKEAVSLYSEGRWKGLLFVGFRGASGEDLLPSGGSGAAELPPGVWGQTHLELDVPQGDAAPALRLGIRRDGMEDHPLAAISLKPSGQPWAATGAGPTPVVITATPGPASSAKP